MSLDEGKCRTCSAPVLWARSASTGKPMPLELDEERGNIVIDGYNRAHAFRDHAAALLAVDRNESGELEQSGVTYISHHATCGRGDDWRNRPRREEPATVAAPAQGSLL